MSRLKSPIVNCLLYSDTVLLGKLLLRLIIPSLVCLSAYGQQSGFYYGAAATLQDAEIALNRTIQSQVDHIDIPETQLSSPSEVDEKALQWDALAGFRINLADNTQFLAIQAELALLGDDINRPSEEEDPGPGQQIFGSAWPQNWGLETSRSIGIISKYGINRKLFNVVDLSLYGLAGVRKTKLDFFSSFLGCYQTDGCSVDELRSETTHINPELNIWVLGIGTEIHLGLKTAFQIELRGLSDAMSEWESEFADGDELTTTPFTLEQGGTDLSMKLIRYL